MTPVVKTYLVVAVVVIALVMIWGPLRDLIGAVMKHFLVPPVIGICTTAFLWSFWLLKRVLGAHLVVTKNLLTPHKVVFPSLKDDDERSL